MATESSVRDPVASAASAVAFALAGVGSTALGWTATFLAWGIGIDPASATVVATGLAVVHLVALGCIGVAAEGGPTLSMAAYVGVFTGAAVAFLAAVWITVVLLLVLPLGGAAVTVASVLVVVLIGGLTVTAVAALAALGRSTDWGLVLRMAVAMLLLVLVTVGLLAAVWTVSYVVSIAVVGPVFGIYAAGAAALAVLGWIAYREFEQVGSIERRLDATPTTPDDLPGIHATTTKVASQLGVPKPTIAVSETYAPEALVVGFRPENAHLVLSYGAVTALSDDELEAVVAHELAHVANRDAMVMTALSTPVVLAEGLRASVRDEPERDEADAEWSPPEERPDGDGEWGEEEIFGPNDEWRTATHPPDDDEDDGDDGWLFRMTVFVVATLVWAVSRAIVAVLSRARETAADRTAAEVTGSPAALAGALRTLDDRIEETPNRDLREAASVSSLSILPLEPIDADPNGSPLDRLRSRLFRTHPPTRQRLADLETLERDRH